MSLIIPALSAQVSSAPETPLTILGGDLAAWWPSDTAVIVGPSTSGNLADAGTNGYDLAVTGSGVPDTETVNGLQALRYSAYNDRLELSSGSPSHSIVMVAFMFKPAAAMTTSSGVGPILSLNTTYNTWTLIGGPGSGSLTNERLVMKQSASGNVRGATSADISAAAHIGCMVFGGASPQFFLDSTSTDIFDAEAGTQATSITMNDVTIGNDPTNGGGASLDITIGDVILATAATSGQRASIINWLGDKWNVTIT